MFQLIFIPDQEQHVVLCTDHTPPLHPPPPRQTSGIGPLSLPTEWAIWCLRPSQGEEFDLCPGNVRKIEQVKMIFYGAAKVANWYKYFLEEMKELKEI